MRPHIRNEIFGLFHCIKYIYIEQDLILTTELTFEFIQRELISL
jgi:hypothetical protein